MLFAACALATLLPLAGAYAQDDAVSREVSFFNDLQPTGVNEAVSREISFFVDLELAPGNEAVSREVSFITTQCDGVCLAIMPGYPSPPRVNPDQRRKARPDESLLVWGSVNDGLAAFSNADATYEWSFSPNPEVTVNSDGALAGPIVDNRSITEEVSFSLTPGVDSQIIQATLSVDVPGFGSDSKMIEIEIVPRQNLGFPSIADLQVDSEIATDEGLLYLAAKQDADSGVFDSGMTSAASDTAATAFALWAMQNQGHLPTNDPALDVYASRVQRGLDYLFANLAVLEDPADLIAPRADIARGATADDVADMNDNGKVIAFDATSTLRGYVHPIAMAAVLASGAPNRVVQVGAAAGMTYREVIEDAIDYLGHTMSQGGTTSWGGRGGWAYQAAYTHASSDMSINSWAYLALEGAQVNFGVTVPDWMKQEIEHTLANHYSSGMFGYTGTFACAPGAAALATTGGGLSALALVETAGPFVQPGDVLTTLGSLEDIDTRRATCIGYIGDQWDAQPLGSYCRGNRGNYYVMWTVARALRLTAIAAGLSDDETVDLINDTPYPDPAGLADPVLFDWETGEILDPTTGELAGEDHPREGYIPFILRNQILTGSTASTRGYWDGGTGGWVSPTLETSFALLILSRSVFGPPCPDGASPTIADVAPESAIAAGSTVTVTGRAIPVSDDRPIVAVSINGAPVDAIDATGRFFKSVPIELGPNSFRVDVYDTACGAESIFEIEGLPAEALVYEQFVEAGSLLDATYMHTTFNPITSQLLVTARACNVSPSFTLSTPVLMVIESFSHPSVSPAQPDGFTPAEEPYYFFESDSPLAPGDCSDPKVLVFDNPDQVAVNYQVRWMVPDNDAPLFASVPVTTAVADTAYQYAASAVDPEGTLVTYGIDEGPVGMTVATDGLVTWSPTLADVGLHSVRLRASDTAGASTVQAFALTVAAEASNSAPYFTTAPSTQIATGAAYSYDAAAIDPDGDPLTFALLQGPAGMTVNPVSGQVEWPFAAPPAPLVTLEVRDPDGATSTQTWLLSVGAVSLNPTAPAVFGSPSTVAVVNDLYTYQPILSQPDPGETLTATLGIAPAGMSINLETALISWIPTIDQVGPHAVEMVISDSAGASTTQSWTIEVVTTAANLPPIITSTPSLVAVVGLPYDYSVQALDPDGDVVNYELVTPPTPVGVTVGAASGVLSWTPTTAGSTTLAVRAVDGLGGIGNQVFQVTVFASNTPPVITSVPPALDPNPEVLAGDSYSYLVEAEDIDGDLLSYSLEEAPAGMSIHPLFGLITWLPTTSQIGSFTARVRVDDQRTGVTTQDIAVDVGEDTTPPEVFISFDPGDVAPLGQPVQITVQASDETTVVARTLTVGGIEQTLDSFFRTAFTAGVDGTFAVEATATDASGNTGVAASTLTVTFDDTLPLVTLAAPTPLTVVSTLTDIVASISDDNPDNLAWQVSYRRYDTETYVPFATGVGGVSDDVVATLDPTLLPNDTYVIQILAFDGGSIGAGNSGGIEFQLGVSSPNKLGNFRVGFTDYELPVGGLSLIVERVYDSLDTTPGDFGAGWRLGLPGAATDSTFESMTGSAFIDLIYTETYNAGTRVTVTRPDGQRVGFTFLPVSLPMGFGRIPYFEPDPGVTDTLEAIDDLIFTLSFLPIIPPTLVYPTFPLVPFNPDRFRLTTKEGVKYVIDEFDGLIEVEDTVGNRIEVSPSGLTQFAPGGAPTGVALLFDRDSDGRITRISEPDPDPLDRVPAREATYQYDATGNLTAFNNAADETTTFYYENPLFGHYLTRIEDPLGRPTIRTVFDDDGRMIGQCDATGDPATIDGDLDTPAGPGCTEFALDPTLEFQTIVNGRGYRVDLWIDPLGNVVRERRYLDNPADLGNFVDTELTYDEDGNEIETLYADGSLVTRAFDESGNLLARTDDIGTTYYTYNECNEVVMTTDPQGNVETREYNDDCQLLFIHNSLNGTTELRYDNKFGKLSDVLFPGDTDAAHWLFNYDALGSLTGYVDPYGFANVVEYDTAGRLLFRIDRNGNRADFTYDELGRVITETWDTVPPTVITFAYTAAGQLLSTEGPNAETQYEFWDTGRLRSVTTIPNSGPKSVVTYGYTDGLGTLQPGYDGTGNLTHVLDSFDGLTTYQYDALDRLATATQELSPKAVAGTINEKRVDFEYDAADLLRTVLRSSDLAGTLGVVDSTFDYQCGSCQQSISDIVNSRVSDGTVVSTLAYGRDALGNILTLADAEGLHEYAYDGLNRLLSAIHPTGGVQDDEWYSYDSAGNRLASHLSSSYSYDGSRLLEDDTYLYEYDGEGNVSRREEKSTGDSLYFTYDHRSRMIHVELRDSAKTVLDSEAYVYDALNHRIAKVTGTEERHYIYDDRNPILVIDETLTVRDRRLYSRSVDGVLASENAGTTRWFLLDAVGTVRDVVGDDGAVLNHYVYDSFGTTLEESNPGFDNDLRFNAREFDALTGLGYFRARYYEPGLGRFLAEDLRNPFGYDFGRNNPGVFSDPSGETVAIQYVLVSTCIAGGTLTGLGVLVQAFGEFIADQAAIGSGDIAAAIREYGKGLELGGKKLEKRGKKLLKKCATAGAG